MFEKEWLLVEEVKTFQKIKIWEAITEWNNHLGHMKKWVILEL